MWLQWLQLHFIRHDVEDLLHQLGYVLRVEVRVNIEVVELLFRDDEPIEVRLVPRCCVLQLTEFLDLVRSDFKGKTLELFPVEAKLRV